jgi:hypothetical protein
MADENPTIASQNVSGEPLSLVLGLLHDPRFLQFESELEAPNVFHVVGRTFTETWHSTLLGWLFHPESSHGLGDYPLKRLILLASNESELSAQECGIDLERLLVQGEFLQATAKPNEQEPKEISVESVGRFDVFIEKILLAPWKEIRVLVETKIKDPIKITQCNRYIAYIEKNKQEGIFTIPVFIAPTDRFADGVDAEKLFGHRSWIGLDYRKTYEQIIEPCLRHQKLTKFGSIVLAEYVNSLKACRMNEKPLITTEKDRELILELKNKHAAAIEALYAILSQAGDYEPLAIAGSAEKKPIRVKIGDKMFESPSIKKLYLQILEFLYEGNYLQNLELPMSSGGAKQYLLAKEPKHPPGNEFWNPVEYKGYYMETNKSRGQGLKDLKKVLDKCNLKPEFFE